MVMQIVEKGGVEIAREQILQMIKNEYCTMLEVEMAIGQLKEPMVKIQPKSKPKSA
jgi:hypothetical protein